MSNVTAKVKNYWLKGDVDDSRKGLLILLFLAAAIRIVWIYLSPAEPYSDWATYYGLAQSLAAGEGFVNSGGPTAFRPPGYPLSFFIPFRLFGSSVKVAQWWQIVFSVVTVWLIFETARNVWNNRIAFLAGLLLALSPSSIAYSAVLASENLAIMLMVATVYFLSLFWFKEIRWAIIGAGVAAGLLVLTRPGFIIFPIFALLYGVICRYPTLKAISVMILFMAIVIFPWTLRNAVVFNSFIPIATNGGFNFSMSFFENADGSYRGDVTEVILGHSYNWDTNTLFEKNWTEKEIDQALYQAGFDYIRNRPLQSILLTPRKIYNLLSDDVSGVYENFGMVSKPLPRPIYLALQSLLQSYYLIMLALAVGEFARRFFRHVKLLTKQEGLILLPIIYILLLHGVFFAGDRFHLPALPFVYCFSALGLNSLLEKLRLKPPFKSVGFTTLNRG